MAGVVVLFLLRGPLVSLIVVVLEVVGIIVGFVLVAAGLFMLLGPRSIRYRI